jgi:hypothetical protein
MAAWCGRRDVAALLLEMGVHPGAHREDDRQTALHVAAYQGDVELVELLVRHGAPLDVTDAVYGTPPTVWALHAWLVENRPDAQPYIRILHALIAAGARIQPEWLDSDRLRAEPALHAAMLRAAGAA